MSRKLSFSIDEFYHIYNRGTEKRDIFLDTADYLRFIVLLYISNNIDVVHISNLINQGGALMEILNLDKKETLVDIGAYCLMPNHFHFLIKEKKEGGIAKFMGKLATGYSMYFNKRYDRTGKLFQGVFKATHADNDEYLKYLFAYIHLNPIKLIDSSWEESGVKDKNKTQSFLMNYSFSSYCDYISDKNRKESKIINKNAFPEYFLGKKDFECFISDWLSYTTIKATP